VLTKVNTFVDVHINILDFSVLLTTFHLLSCILRSCKGDSVVRSGIQPLHQDVASHSELNLQGVSLLLKIYTCTFPFLCTNGDQECRCYQTGEEEYKVSLRSKKKIDVAAIATQFGGGGHVRAAGYTAKGSVYQIINSIGELIEKQYNAM
jgi:hypothetical protein